MLVDLFQKKCFHKNIIFRAVIQNPIYVKYYFASTRLSFTLNLSQYFITQGSVHVESASAHAQLSELSLLQTKLCLFYNLLYMYSSSGLDYSGDPFYNHVFLEHHLDSWCPTVGPVRHFMETLCIGLSKNPYMSSQKKVDTIFWFKEYFERPENQEILIHAGCWEEPDENVENVSN